MNGNVRKLHWHCTIEARIEPRQLLNFFHLFTPPPRHDMYRHNQNHNKGMYKQMEAFYYVNLN